MNDRLLLRKIVNVQDVQILLFIHPNFDVVSDINNYDNPSPSGIIYNGSTIDNLCEKLNSITPNWIIVNQHSFDVDLSTNEGLLKNLLPLQYSKICSDLKEQHIDVNKIISYDDLLNKVKVSLIDGSTISITHDEKMSVYELYNAILLPTTTLEKVYFNIVNSENIGLVTSSVLSFLVKVQSKLLPKDKPNYARLISNSHSRYGKYIRQAICNYVKSNSSREIALFQLLSFLNKVR